MARSSGFSAPSTGVLKARAQPGPDLGRDVGPVGQIEEALAFAAGQGEKVGPGFQALKGWDALALADTVDEGPRQPALPGEVPDRHATGLQKPVEQESEAVCHPLMLAPYPAACDGGL